MTFPSPSRRAVLTTAAWSVPAVSLAASAPAFATSDGKVTLSFERGGANDGEVTITNASNAATEVTLTFTPTPDEDVAASLQSHHGFDSFTQVSTEPFSIRGTVAPDSSVTGWCWWRPAAGGTGTTSVQATATGQTISPLTVPLG